MEMENTVLIRTRNKKQIKQNSLMSCSPLIDVQNGVFLLAKSSYHPNIDCFPITACPHMFYFSYTAANCQQLQILLIKEHDIVREQPQNKFISCSHFCYSS